MVILPMVTVLILAALAPMILHLILVSGIVPFDQNLITAVTNLVAERKVFGYSLWLLVLWIVFFIEWTDYYLDIWVLTDRRIIDIEQKGFFHREVTSFRYEQIQDITVETRGLIETFFKFATLHIQTAGHQRDIIIKDAHYPEEARTLILRMQQKAKAI